MYNRPLKENTKSNYSKHFTTNKKIIMKQNKWASRKEVKRNNRIINLYSTCIPDIGQHLKSPLGSSILHVGQPQPQPFKYFALNAMVHLGKLHSILAPH